MSVIDFPDKRYEMAMSAYRNSYQAEIEDLKVQDTEIQRAYITGYYLGLRDTITQIFGIVDDDIEGET